LGFHNLGVIYIPNSLIVAASRLYRTETKAQLTGGMKLISAVVIPFSGVILSHSARFLLVDPSHSISRAASSVSRSGT